MKFVIVTIMAVAIFAIAVQIVPAQTQTAEPIKVRGCLAGNGSKENPWTLRGAVLPAPPAPAPAGGGGGGGGRGAGAGGRGGAGGAGRGGDGGARGADGAGRGAAPPAAAPAPPAPPPQPPVDLRLTDIDMSPWRNMFVEVEGTLGPRPANGLREFKVNTARSAYGDCR